MKISEIKCKTALSPSRLPGLVYSLNPYKGCQHKCAYCYVPNVLKIKRNIWGDFVDAKINIPMVLSKELKKKKPGVVGISTVTDPYQPVEDKYKLTRYCLEQLLKHDFPVSIQTKSSLVTRDIDILSKFSDAEIIISIATLNDSERKILEPYSSSIESRLKALRKCSDSGLTTCVFFGPIYPTISTENLSYIIDEFISHGASKIWIDSLNLKPGIIENIKQTISKNEIFYNIFLDNVVKNKCYYKDIKDEILKIGKKREIEIINAF